MPTLLTTTITTIIIIFFVVAQLRRSPPPPMRYTIQKSKRYTFLMTTAKKKHNFPHVQRDPPMCTQSAFRVKKKTQIKI